MKKGMLTGKDEGGANATQLPKCKSVRNKQGDLVLSCKMPGSTEYVDMPKDWSELFSPEITL